MSDKISLDMILARNTGTSGSPVWSTINNVRDLTLGMTKATGDTSKRGVAFKTGRGTMKEIAPEFEMVYNPSDTDVTTLQSAWFSGAGIEFAFADGVIATTGTMYIRATCEVTDFTRKESLEGAALNTVKLMPTNTTTPSITTT